MSLRVLARDEAEADIAQAALWYERQSAGLGEEFVTAVDECFDLLARQPEVFPVVYRSARVGLLRNSLSRGVSRLSKFRQCRCGDPWAKEAATLEGPSGRLGR